MTNRTVSLDDSKYEFDIDEATGLMLQARRNGEDWSAGFEMRFIGAFMQALWRILELEDERAGA